MAALTAALISVNWGIYVWAIGADRAVDTALGYYINPLVNVVLGAVFLGERFTRTQIVAVGLAVVAVALLTIEAGGLPWVSLALALSFGLLRLSCARRCRSARPGFLARSAAAAAARDLPRRLAVAATGRGAFRLRHRPFRRRHAAPDARRPGHGGAADPLCERREAAALLDHRHHAVHRADDDLPDRAFRLPRAVQHPGSSPPSASSGRRWRSIRPRCCRRAGRVLQAIDDLGRAAAVPAARMQVEDRRHDVFRLLDDHRPDPVGGMDEAGIAPCAR